MKIRFVTCSDRVSALIRLREGSMAEWVGFTPSHAEIVVPDGYLGAHYDGGVMVRPVGYDKAYLTHEHFISVDVPHEAKAEAWARGKVGEPYDWKAIVDFVLPENWHSPEHVICSAFCTGALEAGGLFGPKNPLALAWHQVSPALLFFWLSGR